MIVIGQSHVRALLDGYEILARAHEEEQEAVRTSFVVTRPERTVLSIWQGEGFVKDTSNSGIPEVIATWDPTRVVLAWGGNQMNLRALVASDRPFDVLTPSSDPAAAPDPSAELIPCTVVDRFVRQRMEQNDRLRELMAECVGRRLPVCILVPPPPLPEGAVRERLVHGPHFVKVLEQLGKTAADVPIVPDAVRQRLWTLMAEAYRTFAEENDLDILDPPEDAFDGSGMLAPSYWGQDPTHANGEYGAAVLGRAFAWAAADPIPSRGR